MLGYIARGVAASVAVAQVSRLVNSRIAARSAPPRFPVPPEMIPVDTDGNPLPVEARREFGVPGAALYSATQLSEEAVSAGIEGENRVAQRLSALVGAYPNTYLFHSVKLPGNLGDVDHLVVQGGTIILIDSKNWKHGSAYHVVHADAEADYVTRDGEAFAGGQIHLRRQTAEWQHHFASSGMRVSGVLVIANQSATVSESVGAPYTIANLDGLELVLANSLTMEPVAPLHPQMLHYLLGLIQGRQPAPTLAAVWRPRRPVTTMTKWLVAWSVLNYTLLLPLFLLSGASLVPLLILTHIHLIKVRRQALGGSGLLLAVLAFSYLMLIAWLLFVTLFYLPQRQPL